MAFRFKDLMVNVVKSGGEGDPFCTIATIDPNPAQAVPCTIATIDPVQAAACTIATIDPVQAAACTIATIGTYTGFRFQGGTTGGAGFCTIATVFPGAFATVTTVTTVTTVVQTGPAGPTSLTELKEQLRQALAEVERREQEQEAGALPRTVEEADDLEQRLKGALKELQEHRKSLEEGSEGQPEGAQGQEVTHRGPRSGPAPRQGAGPASGSARLLWKSSQEPSWKSPPERPSWRSRRRNRRRHSAAPAVGPSAVSPTRRTTR